MKITGVKILLFVNFFVFMLEPLMGVSTINDLSLWSIQSNNFYAWQLFTALFLHGGIMHIVFNMFALWVFGKELENLWGIKKFLIVYFICGIGSSMISLLYPSGLPAIGASGAIAGLIIAFVMLFPNKHLYLYFLIPIKSKWIGIGFIVIETYSLFFVNDNVGHFTHLCGMFMGAMCILILYRKHFFQPSYSN